MIKHAVLGFVIKALNKNIHSRPITPGSKGIY